MQKLIILLFAGALIAQASEQSKNLTAEQAIQKLQKGNERFVKDKPRAWSSDAEAREKLAAGQSPYACIVSCADSRVPPEQIFDTGLGELFVVRVAGNVTPREVVASVDYAVGHLGCPVVVVMGHTKCGAVAAALSESEFDEPLNSLVAEIRPVVDACHEKGYNEGDLYEGAIKENARSGASKLIAGSRAVEDAVAEGNCVVLSAVYDISTGEVHWQSQFSAVNWDDQKHEDEPALSEVKKAKSDSKRGEKVASTAREEHAERTPAESAKKHH